MKFLPRGLENIHPRPSIENCLPFSQKKSQYFGGFQRGVFVRGGGGISIIGVGVRTGCNN